MDRKAKDASCRVKHLNLYLKWTHGEDMRLAEVPVVEVAKQQSAGPVPRDMI
jgi:hypothetical protein